MKKTYILIIFFTLLFLWGCGSKTSIPLAFDGFTMKLYNNEKQYMNDTTETSVEGMMLQKQMKEIVPFNDSWYINSLLIFRIPIASWIDFEELVSSNIKTMQTKMVKYVTTDSDKRKIKCDNLQYSWYITTFSYQLGTTTIYGGQYFFAEEGILYLISLSSDEEKDIKAFIKSAKTVKCKK